MCFFWGRGGSLHNPSCPQHKGTNTELESSSHGKVGEGSLGPETCSMPPLPS